jgi:DNA-binding NarL/FixJ family response regulator
VLYGRVPTLSLAQVAAAAAARGVGIVAIADVATPPGRMLLTALEHLGQVHQVFEPSPAAEAAGLRVAVMNGDTRVLTDEARVIATLLPEQRALLGRLANGETIATAAAAEYLSLRTANRRIAQARASLGVRTTREAVLVFIQQRRPD